jgi:hypothetical protein
VGIRRSRQMAVAAAHEDGDTAVEPLAAEEPGLRQWLHDIPQRSGARAAAELLSGAARTTA